MKINEQDVKMYFTDGKESVIHYRETTCLWNCTRKICPKWKARYDL